MYKQDIIKLTHKSFWIDMHISRILLCGYIIRYIVVDFWARTEIGKFKHTNYSASIFSSFDKSGGLKNMYDVSDAPPLHSLNRCNNNYIPFGNARTMQIEWENTHKINYWLFLEFLTLLHLFRMKMVRHRCCAPVGCDVATAAVPDCNHP